MLKVEPMIRQQNQMKYIIKYLKYLPKSSLSLLLNIFNTIWISGDFPTVWRTAIIINIPKPGKDPTNTTNYRPIAILIEHPLIRMMNPIPTDLTVSPSFTIYEDGTSPDWDDDTKVCHF